MKWQTKTYSFEQVIPLPRETVWDIMSQTERMNKMIGLFPVSFSPAAPDGPLFREAEAKANRWIQLKWKEYPFQWVKNSVYSVQRVYSKGPYERFLGGIELTDAEDQLTGTSKATRLRVFAEFTPSSWLGVLAATLSGMKGFHETFNYCIKEQNLRNLSSLAGVEAYQELSPQKEDKARAYKPIKNMNISKLDYLMNQLVTKYAVNKSYVTLLNNHLLYREDQEVVEMQPIILADSWGADQGEVLRLFLYATKVGILNLSWNLMCPNCRISKTSYTSLSMLEQQFHCDLCGVNYTANFDRYVELRFSVHQNIRSAVNQTYCIGGPFITPHVWVQLSIESGKSATFEFPELRDELRFRVLRSNHMVQLKEEEVDLVRKDDQGHQKDAVKLIYHSEGWKEDSISRPMSHTPIHIKNESPQDIVLVLEKVAWDERVVTAARVTLLHEFRDLFSAEVLSPGQQVGIENVTIFFSDLLGSTKLYEKIGDAHAYGKVNQHFDYLTKWITKNGGCLVKTIGDAVMAVFLAPEQAVKAAIEVQQYIEELNSGAESELIIKIGLHVGPAIVVNSNDRLDYFGQTVNLAARIQGESQGNDIILSEECVNREEVRQVLQGVSLYQESFTTFLKGIEEERRLIRVKV
jgi:adenylate cyclase